MSEDRTRPSAPEPAARRWNRVLPALTFLAGLLVGALVVGLGNDADTPDEAARRPVPTTTPTPTSTPSAATVTVVVPASCLQAVEQAEGAAVTVREGVEAARRLDVTQLQATLERLQGSAASAGALAQQCRQAAAVETSAPPGAPPS